MIEPPSQEELGYTDAEYKIYVNGFADGVIGMIKKSRKFLKMYKRIEKSIC